MKTQNRPDNLKTYRGQEAKITKRYRLAIKLWPVFKAHPLPDKQRQLLLNYCQSLSGVNKGSVYRCHPIFPPRKKKNYWDTRKKISGFVDSTLEISALSQLMFLVEEVKAFLEAT